MNPSYGDKFDEYKLIGTTKLEARAKLIRDNKQFAEKIESIKLDSTALGELHASGYLQPIFMAVASFARVRTLIDKKNALLKL